MGHDYNSGDTITVREGNTVCQRTRDDIIQVNDDDAADLHAGLDLAGPGRRHDNALVGCDNAQRGDDKLTREDDADHPACHGLLLDEQDERGRDEQLVRERIDKLAEIRYLIVLSGDIAVQKVGK